VDTNYAFSTVTSLIFSLALQVKLCDLSLLIMNAKDKKKSEVFSYSEIAKGEFLYQKPYYCFEQRDFKHILAFVF